MIADKSWYQQKYDLMAWANVSSVCGIVWGHKYYVHAIHKV
jgi:hypothetical protein